MAYVAVEPRPGDMPDGERLEELYREYGAALRRYCATRLRNDSDADDATQETLLKAARALPRFRSGARMWPWLAAIAANVCRDMQRSNARHLRLAARSAELTPEPDDPEEVARRRSQVGIVHEAMRALPDTYRETLFLREYEDRSYEEIASLQGRTLAAVRTSIMRGRRALRDSVEAIADRSHQWPVAAVVAGGWREVKRFGGRLARSAGSVGELAPMGVAAVAATTAAVAAAGLIALGVLGGGDSARAGASDGVAAAAAISAPGRAALGESVSAAAPDQARGAGSSARRTINVAVPAPVAGAPHATSALDRSGDEATLDAKLFAHLPAGVGDVVVGDQTHLRCDYSAVRQAACDAVDQLPGG